MIGLRRDPWTKLSGLAGGLEVGKGERYVPPLWLSTYSVKRIGDTTALHASTEHLGGTSLVTIVDVIKEEGQVTRISALQVFNPGEGIEATEQATFEAADGIITDDSLSLRSLCRVMGRAQRAIEACNQEPSDFSFVTD